VDGVRQLREFIGGLLLAPRGADRRIGGQVVGELIGGPGI